MNYLAHIYLSAHSNGLLTGNFIADAVKGRPEGRFPEEVVRGIIMHRAIDEFTDKHAATKEAVSVFTPEFKRYAPVLIDIVYDHLLADNWYLFSDTSLPGFANDVYKRLGSQRRHFPQRMQLFYDNMVRYDFLTNYGRLEGIEKTLERLKVRANTDVHFPAAIATMESQKGRLRDLFIIFFNDLLEELDRVGYRSLK